MRYTNNCGIDQPIANAIESNVFYDKPDSDVSISQLIKPVRAATLEFINDDDVVIDVSDGLWMLLGSAVHAVIDASEAKGVVQEERLYMEVNGWEVSGKPDLLDKNGVLTDYKVTSVWAFINSDKPEWEMQLNFYAALLRANGYTVSELRISAILRDWVASRAKGGDYPTIPFMGIKIPLWSDEYARNMLSAVVDKHQAARAGNLPLCTDKERWKQANVWAVMKRGRKSAVKLFDTKDEAELLCHSTPQSYVELRPGKYSRCEGYCHAAPFCTQYRKETIGDIVN